MRRALLLLAAFGLVGTLWAADPSLGTWKLNLAKSKIPASDLANLKESVIVMKALDANTYESVSTDTHKDGSKTVTQWTVPKDGGMQVYQQGNPGEGLSVVSVKIDPYDIYAVYLMNGKQVGLFHMVISKDGKTITGKAKVTDAQGKPFELVNVFEKQ
jgi:hypothetical protein